MTITQQQTSVMTGIDEHLCGQSTACGDVPLSWLQYQFTKLVSDWTIHLQHTSWQITGNKQVAEDIVQEAFLRLWQQRIRIIPENAPGWLKKVVTNLSLQHVKRTGIQIRIYKTLSTDRVTSRSEVEEQLIGKEKQYLLNHISKQLSAQQQLVLHLSKDLGLRRQEIAERLQLSPNTVKVHLNRAMQFLKEQFSCMILFAIFFGCNLIFFQTGNTKQSLIDLFTTQQLTGSLLEKLQSATPLINTTVVNKIVQAVTISLNQ